MSPTPSTQSISKFVEPGVYIAWVAAAVALVVLVLSAIFPQTVIDRSLSVNPGGLGSLQPIALQPTAIGAWRIDVKSVIPQNRWVTYEIRLLDPAGKLLNSAIKQSWKESDTLYEDADTGRWEQENLLGGLDVRSRAKSEETVTIALAVLTYTDNAGKTVEQPVSFQVKVQKGVADTRYLWAGFLGATGIATVSSLGVRKTGTKVISKSIDDSEAGDRAVVGGSDRLVRLSVDVKADETTPSRANVDVWVKDGYGNCAYHTTVPILFKFQRNRDRAKGNIKQYFILEKRGSYGFYVEVNPDEPVERTEMTVLEGVRTIVPVNMAIVQS